MACGGFSSQDPAREGHHHRQINSAFICKEHKHNNYVSNLRVFVSTVYVYLYMSSSPVLVWVSVFTQYVRMVFCKLIRFDVGRSFRSAETVCAHKAIVPMNHSIVVFADNDMNNFLWQQKLFRCEIIIYLFNWNRWKKNLLENECPHQKWKKRKLKK